jgi:hypothetical protein
VTHEAFAAGRAASPELVTQPRFENWSHDFGLFDGRPLATAGTGWEWADGEEIGRGVDWESESDDDDSVAKIRWQHEDRYKDEEARANELASVDTSLWPSDSTNVRPEFSAHKVRRLLSRTKGVDVDAPGLAEAFRPDTALQSLRQRLSNSTGGWAWHDDAVLSEESIEIIAGKAIDPADFLQAGGRLFDHGDGTGHVEFELHPGKHHLVRWASRLPNGELVVNERPRSRASSTAGGKRLGESPNNCNVAVLM